MKWATRRGSKHVTNIFRACWRFQNKIMRRLSMIRANAIKEEGEGGGGANDTHDPTALWPIELYFAAGFFLLFLFCGHSSRFARDGNLIIDRAALDDDNRPVVNKGRI